MAVNYQAVQWTRQKRIYDLVLCGGVGVFLILFVGVTKARFPLVTDEIVLIRAFAVAALALLHVVLCIGPLCRLNPGFLPLLYNRRHAGVTVGVLSTVHGASSSGDKRGNSPVSSRRDPIPDSWFSGRTSPGVPGPTRPTPW